MAQTRRRALVTAAVRGPGLELLHELADLVLDPWLDQRPLRIYNETQLAERTAEAEADIVIVGDRSVRRIPSSIARCWPSPAAGATPPTSTWPAATEAGIPVLRAPARNADAVAELAVSLLFAATRGVVPADLDVRAGEVYRDGTIPYQRFRAWEIAGQTAGLVGLGAVGRALRWRLRGPRHGGPRLRPLRRPRRPSTSTSCSSDPTSCPCTRRSPRRRRG